MLSYRFLYVASVCEPPYKLFCLYNELGINDKAVEYAKRIDSMKAKVENRWAMNIKKEAKGFLQLQQ